MNSGLNTNDSVGSCPNADLSSSRITGLLQSWSDGDRGALDRLMPMVYPELRKLARCYLRRERTDHTLQATALVNEVYLRLAKQHLPEWQGRKHFFGVAARLMRQILVEHARAHAAGKRGGGAPKVSLDEARGFVEEKSAEIVALDDALTALAKFDERKAQIIEMRYFGGLSVQETADALGFSVAMIGREMRLAQAWLRRTISRSFEHLLPNNAR